MSLEVSSAVPDAAFAWHGLPGASMRPVPPRRPVLVSADSRSLPEPYLRSMFAYHHRRLADDLAARQRYWQEPSTVAVTGASSLVGSTLTAMLTAGDHRVIRLVRRAARNPDERAWRPDSPDERLLAGLDAVMHLTAASVAEPSDERHRQYVRNSRVGPTQVLAELAARTPEGPRVFVSASAVGYYGADRGDEILTEESDRGQDFLADVAVRGEAATAPASVAGIRVVQVRTGLVLSPRGGLLQQQYPLFAAGLGGSLGTGRQWMPWISLDDLTDIYLHSLTDHRLTGAVNAVGPRPERNAEYTRILGRMLNRSTLRQIPQDGPHKLLGHDGTHEGALANQRVHPRRLVEAGHVFRHERVEQALVHLLGMTTTTSHGPSAEERV